MFRPTAALFGMLVVIAVGCGSGRTIGGLPTSAPLTLSGEVGRILNDKCAFAGCHGGGSPILDMDLSLGRAAASIINVPSMEVPELMRVLPGNSANSYLYRKISPDLPIVGDRMPLVGSLTPQERELIRRWIDAGALP